MLWTYASSYQRVVYQKDGDEKGLGLLRSTKWNENLILLRDYAELVPLSKVIVWKTHIPVRTQK